MIKIALRILSFFYYVSLTNSHVFMNEPICRRSKYSNYYIDNNLVDYNIAAPIDTFGYTFPCKGFPIGPPITTINSNKINIILEPGISTGSIHVGGHCQFGISYDNVNFLVLKQVIRNCLLTESSFEIILPDNIPSGNLIVFWTWVNAIGNREYYMDCSDIYLNNGNSNIETIIYGKELIILNLPGYTRIPEFPNNGDYDGRELIINARDMSIKSPPRILTYPTTVTETSTTRAESTTDLPKTTTKQITRTESTTDLPKTTTKQITTTILPKTKTKQHTTQDKTTNTFVQHTTPTLSQEITTQNNSSIIDINFLLFFNLIYIFILF